MFKNLRTGTKLFILCAAFVISAICRSIIEAHGGCVWVSPGSPHGTVFQFMLPACGA
jgi:light-regulated signal transduction histidine kinase (bacteriophytochrome)